MLMGQGISSSKQTLRPINSYFPRDNRPCYLLIILISDCKSTKKKCFAKQKKSFCLAKRHLFLIFRGFAPMLW